jgi:hypothetical protein
MESLLLFLDTLTRIIKSQEIFKVIALTILSSRQSYTELRLALCTATTAKTLSMSGPTARPLPNVCGAEAATCIGNILKRQIQNLS